MVGWPGGVKLPEVTGVAGVHRDVRQPHRSVGVTGLASSPVYAPGRSHQLPHRGHVLTVISAKRSNSSPHSAEWKAKDVHRNQVPTSGHHGRDHRLVRATALAADAAASPIAAADVTGASGYTRSPTSPMCRRNAQQDPRSLRAAHSARPCR